MQVFEKKFTGNQQLKLSNELHCFPGDYFNGFFCMHKREITTYSTITKLNRFFFGFWLHLSLNAAFRPFELRFEQFLSCFREKKTSKDIETISIRKYISNYSDSNLENVFQIGRS